MSVYKAWCADCGELVVIGSQQPCVVCNGNEIDCWEWKDKWYIYAVNEEHQMVTTFDDIMKVQPLFLEQEVTV